MAVRLNNIIWLPNIEKPFAAGGIFGINPGNGFTERHRFAD